MGVGRGSQERNEICASSNCERESLGQGASRRRSTCQMRRLWIYRVAPGLPRHKWRREREQVFGETGGSKHDSRSRNPTWDQRIHSTRNESPRYGKGCRTDCKSLQGRRTEQRAQSRDKAAERVQDPRIHLTSKREDLAALLLLNGVLRCRWNNLPQSSSHPSGSISRNWGDM